MHNVGISVVIIFFGASLLYTRVPIVGGLRFNIMDSEAELSVVFRQHTPSPAAPMRPGGFHSQNTPSAR